MAFRILHTADWHLGKSLYKRPLDEDMQLFINWLVETIEKESIDAVLIAGDVFDSANPSHDARRQYYRFLTEISRMNVKAVVIGGNHDSISNLEASSELLEMLNISVVGGFSQDLDRMIVPLSKDGAVVCTAAAVPYLRDRDLRNASTDDVFARAESIKKGIRSIYDEVVQNIKQEFDGPIIGMGHLYIAGSKLSESERDIQMGNLAGVAGEDILSGCDYFAAGHIHRPQSFCGGKVRYSGSPIPLSFSEVNDEKRVIILEVESDEIKQYDIKVPVFRKLKRIKGSLKQVRHSLDNWQPEGALTDFLEIEVVEDKYDLGLLYEFRSMIPQFQKEGVEIIKDRIRFEASPRLLASELEHEEIGNLKPKEVFERKLMEEIEDSDLREKMRSMFNDLLADTYEAGSAQD